MITKLEISNIGSVTLSPSDMYEGDVTTEIMITIQADNPVLVAKYMKGYYACNSRGDPSMIVESPVALYYGHVTFPVFATTSHPTTKHYSVNVIANCSDVDTLFLMDRPLWH